MKMDRPTCETCPFWRAEDEAEGLPGECHRHAPTPVLRDELRMSDQPEWEAFWPETVADQFCGEHPDFPAYARSLGHKG